MPKALTLDVYYDFPTKTFKLVNPETDVEITLPQKLTPEMHKVVRGK